MAYTGQPLDRYEGHRIILKAIHYFSEHYAEALTIPKLSRDLSISLIHLETAFDLLKGKTAHQALIDYRLSRLCDQMSHDPSAHIGQLLARCGLQDEGHSLFSAFHHANEAFISCFGIDLVEFHQQCCLAELARLQRPQGPVSDDSAPLHGTPSDQTRLMTRFHRPA